MRKLQQGHVAVDPSVRAPPGRWHFHVFPMGRMCSLRRALLLWLVPLFLVVGVASAGFSYWSYQTMVREFMDNQMEQLARSIAVQQGRLMPPTTNLQRIHDWGDYVVQVYGADGKLQGTSWPALGPRDHQRPGFQDIETAGTSWRVYTTSEGGEGRTVQVYQSGRFRTHLAIERAGAALAPVIILLLLALCILWSVAGAMSRAVQDIGRQAARQDADNLTELPLERVPQEIQPLVVSFNSLLTRVRDTFAAKRRFVQDAAHELRTPLTAIALQLENLRGDLPPGTCKESFGQLELGVKRAQHLIDQLLKLSRQEAPQVEPVQPVDLHAQVRDSINALIALADQRHIDLGLAPGAQVPLSLQCAAADLRSALDNLIENALRYTPEGGVVDVRVLADEGGRAAVEVIDTGPGIPAELMGRVFDRFFRVPGSNARGSGLGLAIAQSAATRCGLRVVLSNREDRSGLVARLEEARGASRGGTP